MATEYATWPRASKDELASWAKTRGDDAGRAARTFMDLIAAPPVAQEPVTDADLAAARAENERLTKERDNLNKLEQSHREQANEQFHRANKAEAERDEARVGLRHMEGFERCSCGPCAIHGSAMLADAERDMRQRAADLCDCACMDGIGDKIRAIGDEILALPLKHADREGGV